MAESVFTTGNANIQAFEAATQHARQKGDAAEAERAATEAARLALPAQVTALTAPGIQAAQEAAALATQRAGILGSAPNDAGLAGKPAGDYRVGLEIVSWSGAAITARTPELASRAQTEGIRAALEVPDVSALGTTAPGAAKTLIVQHPERGGILTRDPVQTGAAIPTRRYNVGGVWFVRSSPPREWRADHLDVAGDYGGDWGLALSRLTDLMSDGDRLIQPPGDYPTRSTFRAQVPITIEAPGARLLVNHNGIGLDLRPGGVQPNGQPRIFVGDAGAGTATYRGSLPELHAVAAYPFSTGVRLSNMYWPHLTLQPVMDFGTCIQLYADGAAAAGRDVGVVYGQFTLSRLRSLNGGNRIAFNLAPNPAGQVGRNYLNENLFIGGSFTGVGGGHVYCRDADQPGMMDNTVFLKASFEGNPRYVFDLEGQVDGFKAVGARMETNDGIEAVFKAGPFVRSCEMELDGWAAESRITRIQDAGTWNRIRDNKYPFGYVEYYDGVYYMDNQSGAKAPANWQPRDFDRLPLRDLYYTTGTPGGLVLDMQIHRRYRISVIDGSGLPPEQQTPKPVHHNIVSYTGEPVDMTYEYEIQFVQSAVVSEIGSEFLGSLRWGDFPRPTPRLYGQDYYRIRVQNGQRFVVAHWRV